MSSIFSSFFAIEDEREWIADLEADGIKVGVIRDGDPLPEHLDAPYIYQGSHVLPEQDHPRGGAVSLAHISAHVRFWREHPDAPIEEEPWLPSEPFLRFSLDESREAPKRYEGSATVLLTVEQAIRLRDSLDWWISSTTERDPGEDT